MARITNEQVATMKTQILDDLYLKTYKDLKKRKEQLTTKNRSIYLKIHKEWIDEAPEDLLYLTSTYELDISYPWDRVADKDKDMDTDINPESRWRRPNYEKEAKINYIKETWRIDLGQKEIVSPNYQGYEEEIEPELKEEAENICKESIALISERAKMGLYLQEVLEKNRTHKRLRDALPSSLQKYIPVEPTRTRNPNGTGLEVAKPDFLDERLTTNLLEDN